MKSLHSQLSKLDTQAIRVGGEVEELNNVFLPKTGGGGGGGTYVPILNFKYKWIHIWRSKPSHCQYSAHLYVVCHPFIWCNVAILIPCHLSEFYPNRVSS